MSAGDTVAALPHVKCAQPRRRGSSSRSEQLSHGQTWAAAAVLLLWAAALLPAPAAALNTFSIFAKKKEVSRCGHEHDEAEYSYATARIASVKAQGALNLAARIAFSPAAITVPVWFHVVTKADGTGNVTQATLQAQLDVLNGANGYSGNFNFMLQGIDYTAKDAWYSGISLNKTLETECKSALRRGGNDTLNIYFMDATPYLGFSYYPTVLENSTTAILDGLVISPATLPGGALAGYNLGYTVVHETGHWLLLSHTFQGGCAAPNDYVSDTPMSASASSGCPIGRASCGNASSPDPIHNYMDYSNDPCYQGLTPGQVIRMQWAWATFRSPSKSPEPQQELVELGVGPSPPPAAPSPPPPAPRPPPPAKVSKPTAKPVLKAKPTPKPVPKPTKRPVLQPKKKPVASPSSKKLAASQQKRVAAAQPVKKKPAKAASKAKPKPTASWSRKAFGKFTG